MTSALSRRPGPRPTLPEVSPEEEALLRRLQRLRVLTPAQAHWLVEGFHALNPETQQPRTERNTRMRLQRLCEDGFLKAALTHPEKGGYSGIYYRLGGKGLRALRIPEEKELLRRPVLSVLRYLLLRNEVYARAREAGWRVHSPLLFPEDKHPEVLRQLHPWWGERLEAGEAGEGEGELRFTFDCLTRGEPGGVEGSALVLVVVDDVRRAIAPSRRAPISEAPRARAQSEDLPPLPPGARLLLRDTGSRWNASSHGLDRVSPRLRQWRRALASRYGEAFLDTGTLFPELWSERTRGEG